MAVDFVNDVKKDENLVEGGDLHDIWARGAVCTILRSLPQWNGTSIAFQTLQELVIAVEVSEGTASKILLRSSSQG